MWPFRRRQPPAPRAGNDPIAEIMAGIHRNTQLFEEALCSHPAVQRMRQDDAERRRREDEAREFIRHGFDGCNQIFRQNFRTLKPEELDQLRANHKNAKCEILRTAISLYGRNTVERVLLYEHNQDLWIDYGIRPHER